ncbi:MAG: hypothetical protein IOC90_13885 [Methylocystis sp.]|jgi:hypothetical protein|nr:hypothetical protein [Methylocystis sp.]MCA3583403.1 hypothetical protein [Methylocystis sp.]MCA3589104.1 hypothetical protein [Methylocystis sp.]MCA3591922.1 hypothetical protein [Methylocystis sp.]
METGLSVRPVQATSAAPVRVEPPPQRQVARTELPEAQAAQAADETRPLRFEQPNAEKQRISALNRAIDAAASQPTTRVDRDEATQELVFRKYSPSTGRVVQQFPEEAILRQRAYAVQQRREELALASRLQPPNEELVGKQA